MLHWERKGAHQKKITAMKKYTLPILCAIFCLLFFASCFCQTGQEQPASDPGLQVKMTFTKEELLAGYE